MSNSADWISVQAVCDSTGGVTLDIKFVELPVCPRGQVYQNLFKSVLIAGCMPKSIEKALGRR